MLKFEIVVVTPFAQNCTLFWCDETMQGAVVDPGGDLDKIKKAIAANNVTLEKVLVTHGHVDHAGVTKALAEAFNVPIEGPHIEDKFWIDSIEQQKMMFGITEGGTFEPTRFLDQGDTVSFGNVEMEVYFCPGHTPGHVVFFNREAKLAQVGDVIFDGSIGRTDFPKGDHATLIKSIRETLFPLGDDVRFIPGHGPMSTFGEQKRSNPYVSG